MIGGSLIVASLTVIATIAVSFYVFFRFKFSYWERRGVPVVQPTIPFGNVSFIGKVGHKAEILRSLYQQLKGKCSIGGLYFFSQPVLMLLDLDIIKTVLIKDFQHFADRGVYYNKKDDPLSAHLIRLDGSDWKRLRSKLTPSFTSGKMKFMFTTMVEVADRFQHCLIEQLAGTEDAVLEMKELLARFTTDVIGTCAFGIECNSLSDPNSQFRLMGKKVFGVQRNSGFQTFLMTSFPQLARRLHMKQHHDDVSEFFLGIVKKTVEYRERGGVRCNDFMDLLIDLKNEEPSDGEEALSMEELAAQAFVFFLAGFETSSTTMAYALYELSQNMDIQRRAREEIQSVLARHGGQFTYEAMLEMNYIEQILTESLRKYPPATGLFRRCTQPYTFADSGISIEAETMVFVPVYAIHHDEEYYPEPERFDPDRFAPDALRSRRNETLLSFGLGPRNCIGMRFGMLQARVGLVTLLRNFEIRTCSRSVVPLKFSKIGVMLTPEKGLFLEFLKL